jgi:hypothetical protein
MRQGNVIPIKIETASSLTLRSRGSRTAARAVSHSPDASPSQSFHHGLDFLGVPAEETLPSLDDIDDPWLRGST